MVEGVNHMYYMATMPLEPKDSPYDDLSSSIPYFYDAEGNLIATSKQEYADYVLCKRYGLQWRDRANMANYIMSVKALQSAGQPPLIKTKRVKGSLIRS